MLSKREIAERAYVAGILDGEGCLHIKRGNPKGIYRTPRYSPRISVSMTDRAPVEAVARLAGRQRLIYRRERKPYKAVFIIDINDGAAAELAAMVLPFLTAKKRQALAIIKFWKFKQANKGKRKELSQVMTLQGGPRAGMKYRVYRNSKSYVRRCDKFYLSARNREVTNNGVASNAHSGY